MLKKGVDEESDLGRGLATFVESLQEGDLDLVGTRAAEQSRGGLFHLVCAEGGAGSDMVDQCLHGRTETRFAEGNECRLPSLAG